MIKKPRKERSDKGRMKRHSILDSLKNKLTISYVAKATGIPYITVYNYVTEHHCLTVADVTNRRLTAQRFGNKKQPLHKTKYGMLTVQGIYDVHDFKDNINIQLLSSRLHEKSGMDESLWEDRKLSFHCTEDVQQRSKESERKKKENSVKAIEKTGRSKVKENITSKWLISKEVEKSCGVKVARSFNRNTFCRRDGFEKKCKHFYSCNEDRVYKKTHHKRYREDGSCYCDKKFKGNEHLYLGGRGAREFTKNGSYKS